MDPTSPPARSDASPLATVARVEATPINVQTRLTRRQREVLELVAAGCSNQAVARLLRVTEHTVEGHLNQIFTKLDLEPRADSNRRVLAVLRWLAA